MQRAEPLAGLDTLGLPQLIKHRDSAFVGTDLLQRLRTWRIERILLAGVSVHLCLAQTAADAYAQNLRVAFAQDAMGGGPADGAEAMLEILHKEYRQELLDLDGALALLHT